MTDTFCLQWANHFQHTFDQRTFIWTRTFLLYGTFIFCSIYHCLNRSSVPLEWRPKSANCLQNSPRIFFTTLCKNQGTTLKKMLQKFWIGTVDVIIQFLRGGWGVRYYVSSILIWWISNAMWYHEKKKKLVLEFWNLKK